MKKSTESPIFIGIDVSKASLDVAVRPTGETWQVSNDPKGIEQLVEKVRHCIGNSGLADSGDQPSPGA
jgi:transposase